MVAVACGRAAGGSSSPLSALPPALLCRLPAPGLSFVRCGEGGRGGVGRLATSRYLPHHQCRRKRSGTAVILPPSPSSLPLAVRRSGHHQLTASGGRPAPFSSHSSPAASRAFAHPSPCALDAADGGGDCGCRRCLGGCGGGRRCHQYRGHTGRRPHHSLVPLPRRNPCRSLLPPRLTGLAVMMVAVVCGRGPLCRPLSARLTRPGRPTFASTVATGERAAPVDATADRPACSRDWRPMHMRAFAACAGLTSIHARPL